jgi:hypothetical protein
VVNRDDLLCLVAAERLGQADRSEGCVRVPPQPLRERQKASDAPLGCAIPERCVSARATRKMRREFIRSSLGLG